MLRFHKTSFENENYFHIVAQRREIVKGYVGALLGKHPHTPAKPFEQKGWRTAALLVGVQRTPEALDPLVTQLSKKFLPFFAFSKKGS
jgi:hypothetical protein